MAVDRAFQERVAALRKAIVADATTLRARHKELRRRLREWKRAAAVGQMVIKILTFGSRRRTRRSSPVRKELGVGSSPTANGVGTRGPGTA